MPSSISQKNILNSYAKESRKVAIKLVSNAPGNSHCQIQKISGCNSTLFFWTIIFCQHSWLTTGNLNALWYVILEQNWSSQIQKSTGATWALIFEPSFLAKTFDLWLEQTDLVKSNKSAGATQVLIYEPSVFGQNFWFTTGNFECPYYHHGM